MLRTSLRIPSVLRAMALSAVFLSSNAQDFIEDGISPKHGIIEGGFLSSNAQDFIEDQFGQVYVARFHRPFLSSNAQDFIEDDKVNVPYRIIPIIPEQ